MCVSEYVCTICTSSSVVGTFCQCHNTTNHNNMNHDPFGQKQQQLNKVENFVSSDVEFVRIEPKGVVSVSHKCPSGVTSIPNVLVPDLQEFHSHFKCFFGHRFGFGKSYHKMRTFTTCNNSARNNPMSFSRVNKFVV